MNIINSVIHFHADLNAQLEGEAFLPSVEAIHNLTYNRHDLSFMDNGTPVVIHLNESQLIRLATALSDYIEGMNESKALAEFDSLRDNEYTN